MFSDTCTVGTIADVHAVLSPTGPDRRVHARAQLMAAWLQFASGAVPWGATVDAKNGSMGFLQLMFAAEEVINDPTSTDAEFMPSSLTLLGCIRRTDRM